MCKTQDLGIHGNLFGGVMLAKIDEAAALFAARVCRSEKIVTLKMGEVIFHKPVKVGNNVTIKGQVVNIGNTSITMNIEVYTYDPVTMFTDLVCTTSTVFVNIDENGRPTPIIEPHPQYRQIK